MQLFRLNLDLNEMSHHQKPLTCTLNARLLVPISVTFVQHPAHY